MSNILTSCKDLSIEKGIGDGGSGTNVAVWILNTSNIVEIRNCKITLSNSMTTGVAIWAIDSYGISIYESRIFVSGSGSASSNKVVGVYLTESNLVTYNSAIIVYNTGSTGFREANCIQQDATSSRYCESKFTEFRNSSNVPYYYFRGNTHGTGSFRFCYLESDTNRFDSLSLIMCN